jgi:hypothetical protein
MVGEGSHLQALDEEPEVLAGVVVRRDARVPGGVTAVLQWCSSIA